MSINDALLDEAEKYLQKTYGTYRGHPEWRALKDAFIAGAALAASKPEPQAQAGEPGNNKGKSNGRNDKQGPALGANLPLGGSPDASVACSTYSSLSSLTDVLWGSDDVMALNAELGLTMDQLVRIANVVLQSHREAMAEVTRRFEELKRHGVSHHAHNEAIAKKDAALDACAKDAARYRFIRSATAPVYVEWYEVSKADAYLANEELDATIDAAITQAQEAKR